MKAIKYEHFFKHAFGADRNFDSSQFVKGMFFKKRSLERIKAKVVYCLIIYTNKIARVSKRSAKKSQIYIDKVMNANSITVIVRLICKYFKHYRKFIINS